MGVNIFILISGYFLSVGHKFKISKLFKLILEVFFYSVLIIVFGITAHKMTVIHAIKLIFAIPVGFWQFITLYTMLYILSPYINVMLDNIQLKYLIKLIVLLSFTWIVFPSFCYYGFDISYSIAWFIFVYILGACIRKVEKRIPTNPKLYLLLGLVSICIIALSEVLIRYVGINYLTILQNEVEHFRQYNSVFVMISAISLFLGFKQLKIKNNKVINLIASTSLAVYMLHDDNIFRYYLWRNVFKGASFQYSKLLIPHAIGSCLLIFICFAIIDLLRQKFIEKPVMKFLTPKIEHLEEKFDNKIDILSQKMS